MLNVVAPDVPVFRAALLGGVMATLGAPSHLIMAKNIVHFLTLFECFSWRLDGMPAASCRRQPRNEGVQLTRAG